MCTFLVTNLTTPISWSRFFAQICCPLQSKVQVFNLLVFRSYKGYYMMKRSWEESTKDLKVMSWFPKCENIFAWQRLIATIWSITKTIQTWVDFIKMFISSDNGSTIVNPYKTSISHKSSKLTLTNYYLEFPWS